MFPRTGTASLNYLPEAFLSLCYISSLYILVHLNISQLSIEVICWWWMYGWLLIQVL